MILDSFKKMESGLFHFRNSAGKSLIKKAEELNYSLKENAEYDVNEGR